MYRVKAKIADDVPRIAMEVEKIPEVENVRYGQGVVEKLLALTNWLEDSGRCCCLGNWFGSGIFNCN